MARRVITVGSEPRLRRLASYFDKDQQVKEFVSHRGFVTVTGYYNGVELSIVSIGMV